MPRLTYEPAHASAIKPLPPIRSVIYTGAIWGGVQVIDKFMRPNEEDIVLSFPEFGYDGLYADAGELAELEFAEMLGELE